MDVPANSRRVRRKASAMGWAPGASIEAVTASCHWTGWRLGLSHIALVQRARPMCDETNRQTVQWQPAVTASIYEPGAPPIAEALRRTRLEFAGTSIVAVAGLEVICFEGPFNFATCAHNALLC